MQLHEIKKAHAKKKSEIAARLSHFERVGKGNGREIFAELCFCLLTPQSKARAADAAMRKLGGCGELFEVDEKRIAEVLRESGVRFHRNKGKYVVLAREELSPDGFRSMMLLLPKKVGGLLGVPERGGREDAAAQRAARDFLVKRIKGLGKKEASHFLRNVGHGSSLAILDRHILKNLVGAGVLKEVPKSLTEKKYDEIELEVEKFCKRHGIPMAHLDLLFWSNETGEIFK